MTEQTQLDEQAAIDAAKAEKKARKAAKKAKKQAKAEKAAAKATTVESDAPTLAALCIKVAAEKGTEQGEVAKKLRARIRSNFDVYAERWPGLSESKDNRDGNRYPPMPRELFDAEYERLTA